MASWTNIFKTSDKLVAFDFGFLKTDIHSHLIPGIDDGAKTVAESVALIKGLKELGYQGAVTTPHIMSDFYKNTPAIIQSGHTMLKQTMHDQGINFNLSFAAEYYLDFDFKAALPKTPLLVFGTNYCLVEFSFMQPPQNGYEILFELQTSGYKPVLAHPERYAYWNLNLKQFEALKQRDIMFQINLLSLTGHYGEAVQKTAVMLLQHHMVEWLGTDLHNLHQLQLYRNFSLKASVAKILTETTFLNTTLEG
jgi:protein-tyrosine phosphatase